MVCFISVFFVCVKLIFVKNKITQIRLSLKGDHLSHFIDPTSYKDHILEYLEADQYTYPLIHYFLRFLNGLFDKNHLQIFCQYLYLSSEAIGRGGWMDL